MIEKNKWDLLLLILIFLFTSCSKEIDSKIWAETTGNIINIEKISDGSFGFELVYEIETNDLENEKNKPIKRPITIYYLSVEEEPQATQALQLKYMRKNPATYKLVDRIRYRK
jgi:hypothetical protein